MNITMKSSSKFKFSYHSYHSAYELDYSSHVMIMIYELVCSLCVMILTCKTLCLIIHITYTSRIRAKLKSRGPRRIWVVSVYASMVLGYGETCEYISYSTVEG
jgi:hypothetical protein